MEQKMRRKDREVTAFEEQISIVSRCKQVHIGMVEAGKAYIVPLDFGYRVKEGQLSFYCHSALEGRKINILKENPYVTFVLDHSFRIGLGNIPLMWTNAFESVMGEAKVVFLESQEDKLELPHDWAIEGPFRIELAGEMGKLPYKAIGWYRKNFTLDKSDAGRRIYIDFDGAMCYTELWR